MTKKSNLTKKDKEFFSKLSSLPNQEPFDKHYWVDYLEINCLFSQDYSLYKEDFIISYRRRKNDLSEGDAIFTSKEDNDLVDKLKQKDKDRIFVSECFEMILSREKIFKTYYPFKLSKDRNSISINPRLTFSHKLYIFLLCCSTLKYFPKEMRGLTTSFEIFCLQILKNIFSKEFKIHLFGSGNNLMPYRRYKGNTFTKIQKLAKDLNESMIKVDKTDFPKVGSGDQGIDFIGWVSNGDKQPHLITISGQAGCTDQWDLKQFTSSYDNWKNIIPFSVEPLNMVFAPFSLRKENGEWHRRGKISNCVLLDRWRLLYHFKNKEKLYKTLPSYRTINDLLKKKTSIYLL